LGKVVFGSTFLKGGKGGKGGFKLFIAFSTLSKRTFLIQRNCITVRTKNAIWRENRASHILYKFTMCSKFIS
jgi:hypothetical protein